MTTKKGNVPKDAPDVQDKVFRSIAEMEHTYFPNFERERAAKRAGKHETGTGFASTFLETMRAELSKPQA